MTIYLPLVRKEKNWFEDFTPQILKLFQTNEILYFSEIKKLLHTENNKGLKNSLQHLVDLNILQREIVEGFEGRHNYSLTPIGKRFSQGIVEAFQKLDLNQEV